jgi:hypothetical protein
MAVDIAYAGSAWEKKETATATTLTKASVLYDYSIRCKFNFTAAFSIGGMDCLYLTHASMTSGVADGVYTFTSDPNGGISEIIRETTNKQKLRTFGHTLYTLDANPAQIRGYRAKFLDADVTMLRNLEVFQYWQNLGYTLMLEPDIENARPLFGVMDYNFSYEHWDDNRITVDFEFVGV